MLLGLGGFGLLLVRCRRLLGRRRLFLLGGFCLLFLLYGGFSSTLYAYKYGQTNYSAWAPLMWPIKSVMTVGILLMLLQAISIFFRDLARATGRELA